MMHYAWNGRSIRDIRAWAAARGERMVRYQRTRSVPNVGTGAWTVETEEGEMPQSLWDNLRREDGSVYREIP